MLSLRVILLSFPCGLSGPATLPISLALVPPPQVERGSRHLKPSDSRVRNKARAYEQNAL